MADDVPNQNDGPQMNNQSMPQSMFGPERKNTYLEEHDDNQIQQQPSTKKISAPKLSGRAA